jgi:hypothetical protein
LIIGTLVSSASRLAAGDSLGSIDSSWLSRPRHGYSLVFDDRPRNGQYDSPT